MSNGLEGKVALVTGASRGIARASALALAKAGAQVLVHFGQGKAEAEAVVTEIRKAGGRAVAGAADLAAADGPHKLAKHVHTIVGCRFPPPPAVSMSGNPHFPSP
jgi:3-oxoacyl-[acyl-carrier protein] reductase